MKAAILILAALALTGCETCKRHQTACAVAAFAVATTIAMCAAHGKNTTSGVDHSVQIPRVDCTTGACK